MTGAVRRIAGLPDEPLDAAAHFFAHEVPQIGRGGEATAAALLIVFEPADHAHEAWRRAAVQELARTLAPRRINAVATGSDAAIASAQAFLLSAPGVTGQYLPLDVEGAGPVSAC